MGDRLRHGIQRSKAEHEIDTEVRTLSGTLDRSRTSRCASLARLGFAFEEQSLADHCGDGRRLERFGDQECRFRAFARQKPFRISSDKNNRYLDRLYEFVHGVETRTAVGKLDIGEDESGSLGLRQRHGLRMGAGNANGTMTETLNEAFEIHGDKCLVLDNEDIG